MVAIVRRVAEYVTGMLIIGALGALSMWGTYELFDGAGVAVLLGYVIAVLVGFTFARPVLRWIRRER